jgi:uncharacterized protein (DUF1015 family)
MSQLEPFRGVRYHPVLFPDLAEVVAPPYDVIGSRERRSLLERHQRNAVRLILGLEDPADPANPARYADAARALAEWLAEGTLIRDSRPSLYGLIQRFQDPLDAGRNDRDPECERTGFIARVRLEPWGRGIHPHERTLAGPKADRLRLLRATRARLDPLFGLFSDPDLDLIHRVQSSRRAATSWIDDSGIEHILWPISEPAVIEALVAGMETRDIVIADGHHRYETALTFREERERAGARVGSADYVLMFLAAIEDPGVLVLPVHRLLSGVDAGVLRERLAGRFRLETVASGNGPGGAASGLGEGGGVLGFLDGEHVVRLVARSPIDREHPAAIVDREILSSLLGWNVEDAVRSGRLRFTTDWREAAGAVARGEISCALLLPPTPVTAVAAAARSGVTLPQKSTYFYPKIPSGIVIDLIDA